MTRSGLVLVFASVVALFGVVAAASAQEAPAPESRPLTFTELKAAFEEANVRFRKEREAEAAERVKASQEARKAAEKALAEAKTDEEKAEARKQLEASRKTAAMRATSASDGPGKSFAPRFLAHAVAHPGEPDSLESLTLALSTSGPGSEVWGKAVAELRARYVQASGLKRVFRLLSAAPDEAGPAFLREVMAKSPDRKMQARACKALADGLEDGRERADMFRKNEAARRRVEAEWGAETVERYLARMDAAEPEIAALRATLGEKYSDVIPDLSIGKPAPEVQITTVDGKPARLSELRGRVVVLDIWTTWCGPCKAMIPHERTMVERLKSTPFSLVSISGDEKRETLVNFLAKESMPWTHWWNGKEGGILEEWDVRYFPTIYVLDAKGVIRHKDIRGQKLENAVVEILEEMGVEVPESRPESRPH